MNLLQQRVLNYFYQLKFQYNLWQQVRQLFPPIHHRFQQLPATADHFLGSASIAYEETITPDWLKPILQVLSPLWKKV